MKKIEAELKSGILHIVTLNDGKLILGEYKGEKTYSYELKKALKRTGIISGHLQNCLHLIESGTAGQIPVAQAFIEDEPGELEFHFEKKWTRAEIIHLLETNKIDSIRFISYVKKNDLLVSLIKNPCTVLKYPSGKNEVLEELSSHDMELYGDKNVVVDLQKKAIFSAIDGFVQKDLFGVVSVSPQEQVKSIGKAHGNVTYENALRIEQDMRSESDVYCNSGVIVGGMARSSRIEAGGSIHVNYGFDNPSGSEKGYAVSGQAISASAIRNYNVRAVFYVVSDTVIGGSKVDCQGTVITSRIKASTIKVGSTLYVNDIEGNSQIFLGPYFVKEAKYTELKNYHEQHVKRQLDLESEIRIIQDKIRHEQKIALIQLQKLKKLTPENISSDVLLNRYYQNLLTYRNELAESIRRYEKQMHLISKERMKMAYFEREFFNKARAEIVCLGTLAAGTVIVAPNETLKIKENKKGVSIKLDADSGKLIMTKLE